jgi:hypothetical protein
MQFMPPTWDAYGVDGNRDGVKDPFNPVDAIFAAARYLNAAGAETDIRRAVFAYNHADWYVDSVLQRAQLIGALPTDLVASLTGLAQGRFPIAGAATYAAGPGDRRARISAEERTPVVAVANGRILRAGRHVVLQDVHGNTYTYRNLAGVSVGPRVSRGTVIGRIGENQPMLFEIRPGGRDAPRIDPTPILNGWKLLETAGDEAVVDTPLRLGMDELAGRVLHDPRIQIYGCGRDDIREGRIDRRVLTALLLLADSNLAPTISSLECGHGVLTSSGNVSEHSTGTAMDIAAVNGTRISPATQGPGSITDVTIRRLLELQGAMKPHQIISLMTFDGADNTLAMSDHDDHIHVGWAPTERSVDVGLRPHQWSRLSDRLADIELPEIGGL